MIERVLIGGGTGFIGKQLAHFLRYNGCEVFIISRKPAKNAFDWEYIARHGLPKGTTSIVNLAGENVLDPSKRWTEEFKKQVYESRIKTTCTLAKAIDESCEKPNCFINISGVGIYPPSPYYMYDEYSEVNEFDYMSKLCHHWERSTDLKDPGTCRIVKIRSGVVLGREGGAIKSMYYPFYFGLGGKIGSGSQYMPWIHIDDLIKLIFFCINNNVTGIFNGVAPDIIKNNQFTKSFAQAMRRPHLFPIPTFIMNLIFNKERAVMLTKGQMVMPKRTIESGFQFKYCDIDDACKAVSYLVPKRFK